MSARRIRGESSPGLGDRVRIVSSTSGREWFGVVLVWSATGDPFVSDDETAAVRWYPKSWVAEVFQQPGRPLPCSCFVPGPDQPDAEPKPDPDCDHHADTSAILKRARAR
ncbi:hypothetical protein [Kribbella sp. CA-293567]|uniref:hypothetical protein n=1 Tax=Kribbella sp. CA-293567 TaxID=3002436 RepID=UPI0022DDFB0A|nr:hypothetical protein [Kribbella sp. CA-293567]WBQ03819.1 hypothetical protein OX958_28095 [Kribbella sp. CA-293567]